jgi:predicted negative regulator of RcsB-dependent stress response
MANRSSNSANYREAINAVKRRLDEIAAWNRAPHMLASRAAMRRGQLDLDWNEIDEAFGKLRAALPLSRRAAFDRCVQNVAAAFGAVILHATETYDDELNRIRGWEEFWRELDNGIREMRYYIDGLPPSLRSRQQPGREAAGE